jgi:puromycin-sensitive aminopeptidase
MKWWNDLWLNESFATWMSYKQMDGWKPGWRVWLDFNAGREDAFALDALDSTHPIYANVKHAEDAKFDVITYEKGAATLRMIESFVGEKQFRAGIRQYMKRFAYKNATADDLWMAVQDASNQPVTQIANRWIKQSGFPLVEVGLGKGGAVTLRQSRFFSAPGKKGGGVWPVPLIIRYEDDAGVHEKRVLFDKRRAELPLARGKIKWLTANAGSTGFYRVAYQPELMRGLSENIRSLDAAERIGLLSDTWALVRSGRTGVRDWLVLAERFAGEKDPAVLGEVTGRFLALDRLVSDADRPVFQATVARMFGPELARLGWERPAGAGGTQRRESDGVRERRAALLEVVGKVTRDPAIEGEARRRVDRFLAGEEGALDPEQRATAISLAARGGDAALFRAYQKRFQSETDPVLKIQFLRALTRFEKPALAARAQDLVFAGKVPKQDVASFVQSLLANPAARGPFWQRMQREWPAFQKRLADAPKIRQRVIQAFEQVPGQTGLDEVKALLAKDPPADAADTIAQSLERMELAVEFQGRARPDLSAWLAAR